MRIIVRCLYLLLLAATASAQAPTGSVGVSEAAIVQSPTASAPVVARVTRGTRVEVLERDVAWAEVRYGKIRGWLPGSTLTFPPEFPSIESRAVTWIVQCNGCTDAVLTMWDTAAVNGEFWLGTRMRNTKARRIAPGYFDRLKGGAPGTRRYGLRFGENAPSGTVTLRGDSGEVVFEGMQGAGFPHTTWRLARSASVRVLNEVVELSAFWYGNVHDMRTWRDCRTDFSISVSGKAMHDDAAVLTGYFRHYFAQAPGIPPEFRGGLPTFAVNRRNITLQHEFVAMSSRAIPEAQCRRFLESDRARRR